MSRTRTHQISTMSMRVAGGEFTASWPRSMRPEDLRRARAMIDVTLEVWIEEAVRLQSNNRHAAEHEYASWFARA